MIRSSALFLSIFMCALAGFASDSGEKPLQILNLSQPEMAAFVQMLSCHTNASETTINQLACTTQPGYLEPLRDFATHYLAMMFGYNIFNLLTNCCSVGYNYAWLGALSAGTSLIIFKFVLPAIDGTWGPSLDIRRFMTKANRLKVDGKKVIKIQKINDDSYRIKIFSVDINNIEFKTITFNKKDKEC